MQYKITEQKEIILSLKDENVSLKKQIREKDYRIIELEASN